MKKNALLALLALSIVVLAACGTPEVPDELLPTRIPELTLDDLQRGVESDTQPATEAVAIAEAEVEPTAATIAEIIAPTAAAEGAAAEGAAAEEEIAAPAAEEAAAEEAVAEEVTVADAMTETDTTEAVAAIVPTATATVVEPTPEPTATLEPTATPEPTVEPTLEPTATPTIEPTVEPTVAIEPTAAEVAADASGEMATSDILPETFVAALEGADPARGEQLTLQNACIGCHNLDPNIQMAGPTWYNMAGTAASRVEGETAVEYLYNSIVHPNDYLVENYLAGIMLQNYGDTLSEQDIADIVAYLLTLEGE